MDLTPINDYGVGK